MNEKKRPQKSIWFPQKWLDWATNYYKENEIELNKLGINSVNELLFRLAELGKPELADLVKLLAQKRNAKQPQEKS